MNELQEIFILQLIKNYGVWEKNSARFGTYSYGDIADELCMSSSQFSKLLYGSATNGMYERSIKNVEQLKAQKLLKKENLRLTTEVEKIKNQLDDASSISSVKYKYIIGFVLFGLALMYILTSIFNGFEKPVVIKQDSATPILSTHVMAPFFDRGFADANISPFLNAGEAQDFCPCSAYEGTWGLEKKYVIPVPNKRRGLYYRAKEIDMRMKCDRNVEDNRKGKVLLGFEQMQHELWIDTKQEPLTPKYFDIASKNYTKRFYGIDFENDPTFKRVAVISSLFFNTFDIENKIILREGQPLGRFVENIDKELANEYEIDVEYILKSVIGNLVKTECNPANDDHCNPNTLIEEESVIRFDCNFTIKNENLGIGGGYPYTKGYRLMKQNYSDNLLCNCEG